jgi:hypothetical protein
MVEDSGQTADRSERRNRDHRIGKKMLASKLTHTVGLNESSTCIHDSEEYIPLSYFEIARMKLNCITYWETHEITRFQLLCLES